MVIFPSSPTRGAENVVFLSPVHTGNKVDRIGNKVERICITHAAMQSLEN